MKKQFVKVLTMGGLAVAFTVMQPAASEAVLMIDPSTALIQVASNSNCDNECIEALLLSEKGIPIDFTTPEYYKDNSPGGESGSFMDDYSTTWYTEATNDFNGFDVVWGGPDSISCPECYMIVKDGNQDPAQYIFNIGGWDGMETIEARNFWPGSGSISNFAIWGVVTGGGGTGGGGTGGGGTGGGGVPEPATVLLLGLGFGLASRGLRNRMQSR